MNIQQDTSPSPVYDSHYIHMLWIARILSLVPCIILAFFTIRRYITIWVRDGQAPPYYMYLALLAVVPGIIAWSWNIGHVVGGILLILMSAGVGSYVLYWMIVTPGSWNVGMAFSLIYMAIPFVLSTGIGGILHLVYWYKEKRVKPVEDRS